MPTNYPGGLDSLTNPATTDPTTAPSHAGQHTNANDAIEAMQAELGLDPAGAYSTVRLRLDSTKAVESLEWWGLKATYGAVGDGVTDDTTAVQAAFTAMGGDPHHLYIEPGIYLVSSAITFGDISYCTVRGAGRGISIIRQSADNVPILKSTVEFVHDVTFEDFGIEYDGTPNAQTGTNAIALNFDLTSGIGNGFYFWNVRRMYIGYANTGIGISGTGSVSVWGSTFEQIEMLRMHKRGFYFVSPTGIGMPRLTLREIVGYNDPTVQTATEDFIRGNGAQLTISGVDLEGWTNRAMWFNGGEPVDVQGVHIENHKITADGCNLFVVADGSLRITDVAITANQNVAGQTVPTSLISAYDGSTLDASHFDLSLDNTTGSAPNFVNVEAATLGVTLDDIRTNGTLAVTVPHSDAAVVSRVTQIINPYAVRIRAGTTAQQPTAANAGAGGLYYNKDTPGLETSDGSAWAAAGAAAHIADTVDAHDASAVSILDVAGNFAATDVEAAIAEDHGQWQTAISGHISDAADAHDASAISVLDTAANFTGTDVEAVLAELDAAISAGGIPATIVDAKGDLIAGTAADTVGRLAVGTDGLFLKADSAQSTGLAWAAPAGGGGGAATLFVHYANVGNVGTGEDDLYSDTIAAGQLAADGDVIEYEVGGACTFGNADTATIKAYFGGTAIYDSASRGSDNNLTFVLDVRIIRVSSTAIRAYGRFAIGAALANNLAANFIVPTFTDVTGLTLSGTNILKVTAACSAAGNDQVIAKYGTIKYFAAP